MPSIDQAKTETLAAIYSGERAATLHEVSRLVRPRLPAIVETFYATLLTYPETQAILQNKIVEKRLPMSLQGFLETIFPLTPCGDCVDGIIQRHKDLGELHARINVKLTHMLFGLSLIKGEIYAILQEEDAHCSALAVVSDLFDVFTAILSESYFSHEMVHESNELSMRVKGLTQNMAIECERMRSMLLDWLRSTLNSLYQADCLDLEALPKLRLSNFGLWVIYKLDFITTDTAMGKELRSRMDYIDHTLYRSAKARCDGDEDTFLANVNELNDSVTSMSWYLSTVVEQVMEVDTGMDALTRVFSRRYLDTVLRRQTDISLKQQFAYSVLLIDIDHFKKVNDEHGHAGGDVVLKHFAEILLASIRASDFIFRYGGEEFLVLAGNVDLHGAQELAEKIRKKIERSTFMVDRDTAIAITCSIGVAQHTGHPNYNLVVEAADAALYQAKEAGRNRVVLAT